MHVLLSVRCPDMVLLIQPAKSENAPELISALNTAVGPDSKHVVRAISTDSPYGLDAPELRTEFPNVVCVIMDALHVALKVEKATGGVLRG